MMRRPDPIKRGQDDDVFAVWLVAAASTFGAPRCPQRLPPLLLLLVGCQCGCQDCLHHHCSLAWSPRCLFFQVLRLPLPLDLLLDLPLSPFRGGRSGVSSGSLRTCCRPPLPVSLGRDAGKGRLRARLRHGGRCTPRTWLAGSRRRPGQETDVRSMGGATLSDDMLAEVMEETRLGRVIGPAGQSTAMVAGPETTTPQRRGHGHPGQTSPGKNIFAATRLNHVEQKSEPTAPNTDVG